MKQLAFVILVTIVVYVVVISVALAAPQCPCPPDTKLLALWEWKDGWLLAEGGGVTLEGDAQQVTWTADEQILAVMVKSGQDCRKAAGGYAGTVNAEDEDLSSIRFCVDKPTVVMLHLFGARSADAAQVLGAAAWLAVLVIMLVLCCCALSYVVYKE